MKNRLTFLSRFICLFTAVSALFFLLCGCQFIPNDEVARFGTDRKFPDLNYTEMVSLRIMGERRNAVNLTEASVSNLN